MTNAPKGLTFAAVPREHRLTPQQQRRNKLAAHLRVQLAIAETAVAGTVHVVNKRRWEYAQDDQRHRAEVDKRLKQRWKTQLDGTILLSVRYGAKRFEFEKGKDAIAIKNVVELVLVLRKLIDATDGGEFDAMIASANKDRRPIVAKR